VQSCSSAQGSSQGGCGNARQQQQQRMASCQVLVCAPWCHWLGSASIAPARADDVRLRGWWCCCRSLIVDRKRSAKQEAAAALDAAPESKQQQQQQLTAAEKELLEKLVGILTKDGREEPGEAHLLDAMQTINQQINKKDGRDRPWWGCCCCSGCRIWAVVVGAPLGTPYSGINSTC